MPRLMTRPDPQVLAIAGINAYFKKLSGRAITEGRLQLRELGRLPGLIPGCSQKSIFRSGEWFSDALKAVGRVSRAILGA